MTPAALKRCLEEGARERPAFAAGVKRQVRERDTPLGFTNPSCYFCKATVLDDELAMHHEVGWAVIKEYLLNDYDFLIADEDAQAEAIEEQFNYLSNLHAAHRPCNAADGFAWRDREAWRRHEQRVKSEPERWRF
jgi:hypothetical protein